MSIPDEAYTAAYNVPDADVDPKSVADAVAPHIDRAARIDELKKLATEFDEWAKAEDEGAKHTTEIEAIESCEHRAGAFECAAEYVRDRIAELEAPQTEPLAPDLPEKFTVWQVEGGAEYRFPEPISKREAIARIEARDADNLPPCYVLDGIR